MNLITNMLQLITAIIILSVVTKGNNFKTVYLSMILI